jgi:alanine dehydrogenase
MGNIGNLNVDRSTHNLKNRSSPEIMSASRIHQDFSTSPHRESILEEVTGSKSTMIRRAAGKIPHVCIVGAGVAGLRCADVLLQHGARVTILEGRNRVGGRVSRK